MAACQNSCRITTAHKVACTYEHTYVRTSYICSYVHAQQNTYVYNSRDQMKVMFFADRWCFAITEVCT